MSNMEQQVRQCYLDRMDEQTWYDEDPCLDLGSGALPYFIGAFEKEVNPRRRARLVRVIWQFRDRSALPTLAAALHEPNPEVWKDALDGIVTLGGSDAVKILDEARHAAAVLSSGDKKLSWIDEAASQVTDGF